MRELIGSKGARLAAAVTAAAGLGAAAFSIWSEPTDSAAAVRRSEALQHAVALRKLARTQWAGQGAEAAAPALDVRALPASADGPADAAVLAPQAAPFFLQARSAAERERAVRCLATAIYFEAALEPEQGQRAVAQVVLNRVRDPNFPKSVCGVVYQGWERTTGCQFSFTCDGALLRGRIPLLYARAEDYARDALNGRVAREVGTATHYHTHWVNPYWAPTLNRITQVGSHIFYRWPGAPGMPGAFTGRYQGGELALSEAVLTGRAPRPAPQPDELLLGDAMLVAAVKAPDPANPAALADRVRGVLAPGGRRLPTAADIAQINARLQSFETGQGSAAAPVPAPPEPQPPAPTGASVDVVEINKPAPDPAT